MEYQVISYVGVGPIRFGMSKEEVNTALKEHHETFRRGPFAKGDTEMYGQCFIEYNEDAICISVEFFDSAIVLFHGQSLFALSCTELRELLAPVVNSDSGFTSFEHGIGVYAPYEEDDPSHAESIIVFQKGYYD